MSAPVEFLSKIHFSKICQKLWRNTFLMSGTNNFAKIIFKAQFKIVKNFHYICKARACRILVKISIFQKLPKIVEKHFLWWVDQIILKKIYFLAQFKIVQNFHYFCKGRACRIPVKNSIFQKLPKIVEKHFFWWVEQIILQKIFSKHNVR